MNMNNQTFIVNGKEYKIGTHGESCPHCNGRPCECLCKECISKETVEEKYSHCMCVACEEGTIHKSDCAVHNEPAERNGECDCEPEDFKDLVK